MKERGQECLMPLIVGQDGILRAGWQPAPGACVRAVPGGLPTRRRLQPAPQLPSNSGSRETMWRHWIYQEGRIGFMKKVAVVLLIAAAYLGGYGYGRWYAKPAPATTERKPLYWVDPMHPWYKSDKPGIAPDCGMKLVPVYAGERRKRPPPHPPNARFCIGSTP